MKLSVVTLVCKGYEKYYEDWVKRAHEKIKIEHELIVVDNREAKEEPLKQLSGVKIIPAYENRYQFEGRRLGAEAATGDYVWLVDIDDNLLTIENKSYSEDLICFNYIAGNKDSDKKYLCDKAYQLSCTASDTNFFNVYWQQANKNMVWNKWYRAGILKKAYSKVPYGLRICNMEDTLLNILFLSTGLIHSIRYEEKPIYWYFFGTGISTSEKYTDIKKLENLLTGFDQLFGILSSLLPEKVTEVTGIDVMALYRGAALYYLKKYEFIDEEIEKDYTNLLFKYFEKKFLLMILKDRGEKTIELSGRLRKRIINLLREM